MRGDSKRATLQYIANYVSYRVSGRKLGEHVMSVKPVQNGLWKLAADIFTLPTYIQEM